MQIPSRPFPKQRNTLRKPQREGPTIPKEPRPLARATRAATYAGTTSAAPKSRPLRNPALLEMARGRPCLLQVAGVCLGARDTTVAAHSNAGRHGKAGARKADDCYSVWACHACHGWLDQGSACAGDKFAAFAEAHERQRIEWERIWHDTSEPARFRGAARWALEQININEGNA